MPIIFILSRVHLHCEPFKCSDRVIYPSDVSLPMKITTTDKNLFVNLHSLALKLKKVYQQTSISKGLLQ